MTSRDFRSSSFFSGGEAPADFAWKYCFILVGEIGGDDVISGCQIKRMLRDQVKNSPAAFDRTFHFFAVFGIKAAKGAGHLLNHETGIIEDDLDEG